MQKDMEHRHDCVFAFVFGVGLSSFIQKHIGPIDNKHDDDDGNNDDDDEFHPRYQNTNPNASNLFCWCLILYQNVLSAYCARVCVYARLWYALFERQEKRRYVNTKPYRMKEWWMCFHCIWAMIWIKGGRKSEHWTHSNKRASLRTCVRACVRGRSNRTWIEKEMGWKFKHTHIAK